MSDTTKAVFLSYASQDAEAAKKICDALRAAGVEVWFDQSELVGGDAWDGKIRKQIKDCALLIPIISANTQERTEGYFRLEWRLADQRTHLMAKGRAFLLPVVIDDTRDAEAHVPDSFTEVQWTRLPGGETTPGFAARVKKLMGGGTVAGVADPGPASPRPAAARPPNSRGVLLRAWIVLALVVGVVAYFVFKPRRSPEEIAKIISEAQSLAANATKATGAASAQNSNSRPEVAGLLARVRAALARIDTMRTELDTLEGLLGQAAKLDPTDASVWAMWARLDRRYLDEYYDQSPARKDAARRHAAQAQALDPNGPDVRMAQALVMRALSNEAATKEAAAKILEALNREFPDNGEVPIELGWLAFERGRADEALAWFDRAVLVPGNAAKAHFAKAQLLVFIRRTTEAGPEFDRALAAEHASKILLWKSYILMTWDGDLVAARQALNEVPPQVFVEDMAAMTRYYLEMLSRNYDQAVAVIRAVPHDYLQSVAYSGPAGYFKGQALALAGKTAAAELEWRSALATVEHRLAVEPNDVDLLVFKALLQGALGDLEAGRRTWKAMRELYPSGVYDQNEQLPEMQLQPQGEAFAWAERKVTKGAGIATAAQLRLDPNYDPIRSDPRFPALLARAEADPRLSPTAQARPAASTPPLPVDDKSVAVLAFANLSDDKANEYFSDGISEELLNVLAKIPGLKVSARTSAFYFKGKQVPMSEIAQQLGVAYVVEGSVRKQGDKVRITAQLIKAADGFHVWSDTFTRDLKDIFAVQDEIAGLIAKTLQLKIGVVPATVAVNPQAFELYLQGRQAWNLRTTEGFARAETLLAQALELEPGFARAHAALADVWTIRAIVDGEINSFGQRKAPVFSRIVSEIEKALALEPDSSEAHASLGFARLLQWNLHGAERELRRAVALNPNYATGHQWLGGCLFGLGWIDESLVERNRAAELDPFSFRILDNYGSNLIMAGRYTEALTMLDRSLALQPKSTQTLSNKAEALLRLGRRDEAIVIARELAGAPRAQLLATAGLKTEAEAALAEAKGWSRYKLLTAAGRYDEAIGGLRAEDVPITVVGIWLLDAGLDPFRHDPRLLKLLATLDLNEAHARAQAWRQAHPPEKTK